MLWISNDKKSALFQDACLVHLQPKGAGVPQLQLVLLPETLGGMAIYGSGVPTGMMCQSGLMNSATM